MVRSGGVLLAMLVLWLGAVAPASLAAAPPNDDFANAEVLGGPLPIAVPATNVEATRQQGEPEHPPMLSGGHSVWFRWEATSTEVVSVGACDSEFPPIIGVYIGNGLGALTEVAGDTWDPSGCGLGGSAQATFRAIQGRTYSIQVDGNTYHASSEPPVTGEGAFELQIHHREAPANDDFADAATIQLGSGGVSAPNFGATKEPGEPAHEGDEGGASVWFKFTAPRSGGALLQVSGGPVGHESLIAVYTGTSVGALTAVPATEMWGGSALAFPVAAGVTYRIAIDGKYDAVTESPFMDEPEISLSAYPGNDNFEDAYRLTDGSPGGTFGTYGFGNVGATKQPGEPDHAGNRGGSSVWFTWMAYESGSVGLSACGADFHTLLAVYTGSTLSGLTPVAASSNPKSPPCNLFGQGPHEVSFNVDAGTEYRIAVDGYEGTWGGFGVEMQTSNERLASSQSGGEGLATPASGTTHRGKGARGRPWTRIAGRHVEPRRRVAIFHLRSNEPGSRFLCRLDSHPFVRCHATVVYRDLKAGRHTFESEAVNTAGERDRTPATYRFGIERR